jgi:hypothetical protein
VPEFWSVDRGHELVEELSKQVIAEVGIEGELIIHTDPCHRIYCAMCDLDDCPVRREAFLGRPPITLEEAVRPMPPKTASAGAPRPPPASADHFAERRSRNRRARPVPASRVFREQSGQAGARRSGAGQDAVRTPGARAPPRAARGAGRTR